MDIIPTFAYQSVDAGYIPYEYGKWTFMLTSGNLDFFDRAIVSVTIKNLHTGVFKPYKALLDTGSVECLISPKIANDLGLVNLSNKPNNAMAGKHPDGEYEFAMTINDITCNKIISGAFDPKNDVFDVLLGTNFLSDFKFEFNIPQGKFSLTHELD